MIADGPSRGACSVTTPSKHPPANTGAPDIPDHSDAPSAVFSGGSSLGVTVTCTLSRPALQFRQHGDHPDRVHGVPHRSWRRGLGEPRIPHRMAALYRLRGRAVPVDRRQRDQWQVPAKAGSVISSKAKSGPGPSASPTNRGSTLAAYSRLARVAHHHRHRVRNDMRRSKYRPAAHDAPRAIPVARNGRRPEIGDHLDHPARQSRRSHRPTPYAGYSAGRPRPGCPHGRPVPTTVTFCLDPCSLAPRRPAANPRPAR